jgi:hypothetical protein
MDIVYVWIGSYWGIHRGGFLILPLSTFVLYADGRMYILLSFLPFSNQLHSDVVGWKDVVIHVN